MASRRNTVEQQPRPDGPVPRSPLPQQRRTVGRVSQPSPQPELLQTAHRLVEAGALDIKQRVRPVLGRGEVGVDRVDLETGAVENLGHSLGEVVVPEPEPVHPRVDLQMADHPRAPARRRVAERTGRDGRRDRRRQSVGEHPVEVADTQRAEHQDRRPDTAAAQLHPFLDVSACQHPGSGSLQRARHRHRAVPIAVRLDDRDHIGSIGATPHIRDDRLVVGADRVKVDVREGGSHHDC